MQVHFTQEFDEAVKAAPGAAEQRLIASRSLSQAGPVDEAIYKAQRSIHELTDLMTFMKAEIATGFRNTAVRWSRYAKSRRLKASAAFGIKARLIIIVRGGWQASFLVGTVGGKPFALGLRFTYGEAQRFSDLQRIAEGPFKP